MESGTSRRSALAGLMLAVILIWTAGRVAASQEKGAGRQAYWQGHYRDALEHYQLSRRLAPGDFAAADGVRDVYIGLLETEPLLESELGLRFDEAVARAGRVLADLVRQAPLRQETWAGIAEFYGALKPGSQKRRVYTLGSISARAEENLEIEDVLQIQALREATRLDPNGFYYWDILGDLARSLGLRDLALNSYREAVVVYPVPDEHLFLGLAGAHPELAEVAIQAMNLAVGPRREADPQETYRHLGMFLLNLERFVEAREAFDKAQAAGPEKYFEFWQAYCEESQGHTEQAIRLYRRGLARHDIPTDDRFRMHLNIGQMLEQSGLHQEAAQELRNALLLEPREPRALLTLGRIYESLGLISEAEEQYVRSANMSNQRISALVTLVEFYRRIGRPDQALAPARELLKLQPSEEIYRQQVAQIQDEIERKQY